MKKLHSEGKCYFCGKTFAKSTISRHLNSHIQKEAAGKKGKSFHVRVECAEMFLNLWVDEKTSLSQIDDFLRGIWLECCGHMSIFIDTRKRNEMRARGPVFDFSSMTEDEEDLAPGEISMDALAGDAFSKEQKIQYDYDFGSTTSLDIKILEEFVCRPPKPVVLLSRNEPLEILCDICGKEPAVTICSVCIGCEESFFCKKCSTKHKKECSDFADYAAMPVVNSPRMGVCGYEGGKIDTDRDGVYKKKS